MESFCECWNEASGSIKGMEYFYKLNDYQPLKERSARWDVLVTLKSSICSQFPYSALLTS